MRHPYGEIMSFQFDLDGDFRTSLRNRDVHARPIWHLHSFRQVGIYIGHVGLDKGSSRRFGH